jgi:hypothetical protein
VREGVPEPYGPWCVKACRSGTGRWRVKVRGKGVDR